MYQFLRFAAQSLAALCFLFVSNSTLLSQEIALKSKYSYTTPALELAQQLYSQKKYPEALSAFEKIITKAEKQQNYEEVVYAMEKKALVLRRQKRYSKTIETLGLAIDMAKHRLPKGHFLISRVYYSRGTTDHIMQSYYSARDYLDTALVYYNSAASYDSTLYKRLIEYKYYAYQYSEGSKDTLLKYLHKMEVLEQIQQRDTPDPNKTLLLMQGYPLIYIQAGDFDQALAYAIRANKYAQENRKTVSNRFFAESYYDLSRVLYFKKEYSKALEIGLSVMPIVEGTVRSAMPEYYAFNNLLGVINMALENYESALPYFESALARRKDALKGVVELNQSAFEAQVVMNMGICFSKLGNGEKAKQLLKESILLRQSVVSLPNSDFQSHYEALGNFYLKNNDWYEALISYDSALRNGFEAYESDMSSFPANDQFFSFKDLRTLTKKTESLNKLGHNSDDKNLLEAARSYAVRTSEKLMENREGLVASEGKLFLSENFKALYETGLDISFQLFSRTNDSRYFEDALYFSRLSKATLFLEQSTEFELVNNNVIPTGLKQTYFESKVKIETLEKSFKELISGSMTSDSILDINEKLILARKESLVIKDSLKVALLDYEPLESTYSKILNRSLNLDLVKGHALIEYFYGEGYLYVMGMDSESKSFHRVELDQGFEKALTRVVELVSEAPKAQNIESDLQTFIDDSSLLFELLLAPVFSDFKRKPERLAIVPDEFLSRLPFEILLFDRPTSSGIGFDRLNYLIKEFNINYEFSSALYEDDYTGGSAVSKSLLGVGFRAEENVQDRSEYGSLPGTEREINYLKSSIEGTYLIGETGTKNDFIETARDFDILHLAIHGIADSLNRYESSLIFNGNDDNVLNTEDLYLADLRARLAVLSACESGIGSVTRGEGTFSIARGFALVGIPSMVMSLWKVNDKATSDLMVSMYSEFIKNELPINQALRMAKLNYIGSSDEYSGHPYYWAAFLHLGDDIVLEEPKRIIRTNHIFILAVSLTLMLLLFFLVKRKGAK